MWFLAVSLWGAFMMGAIFYTQEVRPSGTGALAAYLVFAAVFTATALIAFVVLALVADSLGATEQLDHPLATGAFQAGVFVPAFLLARRQLRRLARRPRLAERSDIRARF